MSRIITINGATYKAVPEISDHKDGLCGGCDLIDSFEECLKTQGKCTGIVWKKQKTGKESSLGKRQITKHDRLKLLVQYIQSTNTITTAGLKKYVENNHKAMWYLDKIKGCKSSTDTLIGNILKTGVDNGVVKRIALGIYAPINKPMPDENLDERYRLARSLIQSAMDNLQEADELLYELTSKAVINN